MRNRRNETVKAIIAITMLDIFEKLSERKSERERESARGKNVIFKHFKTHKVRHTVYVHRNTSFEGFFRETIRLPDDRLPYPRRSLSPSLEVQNHGRDHPPHLTMLLRRTSFSFLFFLGKNKTIYRKELDVKFFISPFVSCVWVGVLSRAALESRYWANMRFIFHI